MVQQCRHNVLVPLVHEDNYSPLVYAYKDFSAGRCFRKRSNIDFVMFTMISPICRINCA